MENKVSDNIVNNQKDGPREWTTRQRVTITKILKVKMGLSECGTMGKLKQALFYVDVPTILCLLKLSFNKASDDNDWKTRNFSEKKADKYRKGV
jgi:hypothetical protein